MKTVTVKQCENGFVIECDEQIYIASSIDAGYSYNKPNLAAVLHDIFEPPDKEAPDLKVVA